ncbi:50S ribosomal protein L25 [Desulfonema ishimotonii]|uniref:Large ribosomal subunit protein bL25 n=1 Tax=Desulfonema ishimotonii TaxID=45657 RepID=A0A401FYV9_9BACT|nr:50S ribosomal protein L25/general stress protein Ctc [Desulfonema ishimotonii]GBC62182.1 50S ribosomal protein L25 [Desulfonema ishimotonii]
MEFIKLQTHVRTTTGNSPARALRREGNIPAILYGPRRAPVMLSVSAKDIETALKKTSSSQIFFTLDVEGDEKGNYAVMLKELQKHPVSRKPLHADFYEVDMDRKIRVKVPVTTIGKAVGVEMGGMLQVIRRELEVLCFPRDIPDVIELDITNLNMGDAIHVNEMEMENVEFPADVNFTVLTILSPKGKDEEEGGEEEETEEETEETSSDA